MKSDAIADIGNLHPHLGIDAAGRIYSTLKIKNTSEEATQITVPNDGHWYYVEQIFDIDKNGNLEQIASPKIRRVGA